MNVRLDRIDVTAVQYVTRAAVVEAGGNPEDWLRGLLMYRMRSHVLGSRIAEYDVLYQVPKNWWQHLRMQIGLKHKTTECAHKITRYRTYPNADIVLPASKMGQPVTMEVME